MSILDRAGRAFSRTYRGYMTSISAGAHSGIKYRGCMPVTFPPTGLEAMYWA